MAARVMRWGRGRARGGGMRGGQGASYSYAGFAQDKGGAIYGYSSSGSFYMQLSGSTFSGCKAVSNE